MSTQDYSYVDDEGTGDVAIVENCDESVITTVEEVEEAQRLVEALNNPEPDSPYKVVPVDHETIKIATVDGDTLIEMPRSEFQVADDLLTHLNRHV
jgi:hypothetical protein